jgi:hypothetical protein
VTGPGEPRPDRPDRPVEPYEPDPNREPERREPGPEPQPDYPGRYPTYEDVPPTEPKDEEPLTLPRFSGKRISS